MQQGGSNRYVIEESLDDRTYWVIDRANDGAFALFFSEVGMPFANIVLVLAEVIISESSDYLSFSEEIIAVPMFLTSDNQIRSVVKAVQQFLDSGGNPRNPVHLSLQWGGTLYGFPTIPLHPKVIH